MAWQPISDSAKSVPDGVEFGMTDGKATRQCFIFQHAIGTWANQQGQIDRAAAFKLFREHAAEIYAASGRILDEGADVSLTIITAEDRNP